MGRRDIPAKVRAANAPKADQERFNGAKFQDAVIITETQLNVQIKISENGRTIFLIIDEEIHPLTSMDATRISHFLDKASARVGKV